MNPRRTRDYWKGTDEHLPTPILGRPHEPILPREFRVSKPEITPSHDAPASIASLREVGSRMNAVTRAAPRKKNPISKSRTRALLRGE